MHSLTIDKISQGKVFFSGNDGLNDSCTAWKLSKAYKALANIECMQGLTLLTTMEADATLIDWFKVLKVGGQLTISVPDSNYFAQMWIDADWNEATLSDESSPARTSFTALFGEQKAGNPKFANYSTNYPDVNKAAYNAKRLRFLLERVGFVDINIASDGHGVLTATAIKSMNIGERQIATDYAKIRGDHKNRYHFACEVVAPSTPQKILDCACGIGYGTLMLSNATKAKVTGVDIDEGAINYALQYYCNQNTEFLCQDARLLDFKDEVYDAIISFETIEHVPFDQELIKSFHQWLKPGGQLICSTPNQDTLPFSQEKFPYHIKHYSNDELTNLLKSAGFQEVELFTQRDVVSGVVESGDDGFFTVAVAIK